jgi:3-isopropylmalate/(R)-2-methylmalate dehydratase large subunit
VPDTLIEKVLGGASGGKPASPGDIVVCDVDMTILLDLQFSDGRLGDVIKVPDPGKLAIVMDHAVPAPSIRDAEAGKKARAFAAEHGIGRLFDIGRHGIVHQVVAEQGLAWPGPGR